MSTLIVSNITGNPTSALGVVNATSVNAASVNATSYSVGTSVTVNSSAIFLGNSSVNTSINSSSFAINGTVLSTVAIPNFRSLKVQATSDTAVTVSADNAVLVSGSNYLSVSSVSLTLSISTTGANALDTGTVASNTWYSVWIINNGSTTAGLLSTSATSPTLPSGYTYKLRVGWVRVGGSTVLLRSIQYGNRAQYSSPYTLASGTTSSAWSGLAVSSYVPSTASTIVVSIYKDNNNNWVSAAANSSGTVNTGQGMLWIGTNGNYGIPGAIQGHILLESTNIYFASNGGGGINCWGWIDNI